VDQQLKRRIAHNEAVFRDVNEALRRGHWLADEADPIAFRCECGELGCTRMIELEAGDYERIRASPRRFFVAPDHDIPEVETVVERYEDYVVVEKVDVAGGVAERTDPRG
jgi:hypothetical protein